MKAKNALFCGIILVVLGASLYVFSGVVATVYTVSSGSYWTYYEYQYATHYEYQCSGLGVSPLCAFFYHFAHAGAGVLSFAGAVMMTVALYRLIEGARALPTPLVHPVSCPRCGTVPTGSKYCIECAAKLT